MSTETMLSKPAVAANRPTPVAERIVVGVDGSAQSVDALRWAARIAGDATNLVVLTTWEPRLGMPGPFIATPDGANTGPEGTAQALLARAVHGAYGSDCPPNLTMQARRGDAAHILVEESATAQLLVIGSRGLSEVAGLLLGSVSAYCAEKAQCPVLIMHGPETA